MRFALLVRAGQNSILDSAFPAVAFEEWIALGLLAIHLVFGALAMHFHRNETSKDGVIVVENPDVSLDKLC
jgi:hypothetical protein